MIRSFYSVPNEGVKVVEGICDFDHLIAVEGSVLWVDMCQPTDQELFTLTHDFRFHPLAIEDVIAEKSRTKIDDYERYLFLVFHIADYTSREEGLKAVELNFFLLKNALVTVRHHEHRIFDYLYSRATRDERLVARGADYLMHAILDAVIDNYTTTLEMLEQDVDKLEEDVLGSPDHTTLSSIFTIRRDIVNVKRYALPQKEVIGQLTRQRYDLINPNLQLYFSDIYDHLVRILETADTHREILNTSLEVYYSSTTTRTNDAIKVLAVLTAAFVPPTLIASIWGMNFIDIPLSHHPLGFAILSVIMILSAVGTIWYCKKQKWI